MSTTGSSYQTQIPALIREYLSDNLHEESASQLALNRTCTPAYLLKACAISTAQKKSPSVADLMPEVESLGYVHTLKNNVINLLLTTNKSLYCHIAHNINVQFAQNMALQHEYFASYYIYIYMYI